MPVLEDTRPGSGERTGRGPEGRAAARTLSTRSRRRSGRSARRARTSSPRSPARRDGRMMPPPGHNVIGAARAGLTPGPRSEAAGVGRPQEWHDVLLEEGRTIRPDVSAEVSRRGHIWMPAHLPELAIEGALRSSSPGGGRNPTIPALTVLIRSIVPNTRVPSPSTITSSGDQNTTISRLTARRARDRSYVGDRAGDRSTATSTASSGRCSSALTTSPVPPDLPTR